MYAAEYIKCIIYACKYMGLDPGPGLGLFFGLSGFGSLITME